MDYLFYLCRITSHHFYLSMFYLYGRMRLKLITITLSSLDTNLFVILFESSKIFTSFGELTLFHTLTDVVVDEGTLGVQQVKLVVDATHDLCDSSGIGDQ